MAEKKADGAKPRSGWGGRRPGTGRKKGQGKGLTEHLQVSVTPLQKETFRRAGGNMWMRHVLDVESAAELPPGAMVMKTELSHAEIEYEVSSVQAGFPSPADDYAHEPLDFNDLLAPNPENTFVVHVTGDSMVDAGITPGCLLVVSRLLEPRDGDIVIARINPDFTVKRLVKRDGKMELHPENSSGLYRTIIPGECDEWSFIGVVTNVIQSFSAASRR